MVDYDEYEDETYKEFYELEQNHDLKTAVQKAITLAKEYNIEFYDRIIGAQIYDDSDEYERYIITEIFTEHGLKVVFKVGNKGYKNAWIEPLVQCNCDNTCECD